MSLDRHSKRRLGDWWISVALGHHFFAVWLDGKREHWRTEKVGKGAVFGFHIGRIDNFHDWRRS